MGNERDLGRKIWALAGSKIPMGQTGKEPEFTSHDSLWMLNTTDEDGKVEITIYYPDREPVGPYPLEVKARRVRQVRINDLIDPEAIPLEREYGAVVVSSVPMVVQFSTTDTRQAANTRYVTGGYWQ